MEDKNNFSEFTEERYKALYDRIYSHQKRLVSNWTESSREPEKAFNYVRLIFAAFALLKTEDLLKEAIEAFNVAYPLWHTMPELMELIEPIRLRMLEKYNQSEIPQLINEKVKTVERFKILGIIPSLPKVQEVYNIDGELLRRYHYALDLSMAKIKKLRTAKSKEEKAQVRMTLYHLVKVEGVKPLEISDKGIDGEPTRKKLFHAIVRYRAINDFFNHLRVSDVRNYNKFSVFYRRAVEIDYQVIPNPEVAESNSSEESSTVEKIETSKKRQTIAFYYLLTAGGVKGLLSNKSEFARFIAFMSGYDFQANGNAKNINNTSFYRIVKQLFGKKTTSFSEADINAVVQCFQKLDQGDNSLLAKAIEQLEKDKEAQ